MELYFERMGYEFGKMCYEWKDVLSYILVFVNKLSIIRRIQVLVLEIRRSSRRLRTDIQIDITKYSLLTKLPCI